MASALFNLQGTSSSLTSWASLPRFPQGPRKLAFIRSLLLFLANYGSLGERARPAASLTNIPSTLSLVKHIFRPFRDSFSAGIRRGRGPVLRAELGVVRPCIFIRSMIKFIVSMIDRRGGAPMDVYAHIRTLAERSANIVASFTPTDDSAL